MSAVPQGDSQNEVKRDAVVSKQASRKTLVGSDYKGFAAGVFSGLAKLTVGHPFDTIKVRLQTTSISQFNGPLDCLVKTVKNEGIRALYKGASPPLIGWMFMDSLMLGSLSLYRRLLNEKVFNTNAVPSSDGKMPTLPVIGHAVAGWGAGVTVSFIAAPIEHVKARLQVQYQASKLQRLYTGPIDCTKKIYAGYGIRGLYHGLFATLVFRSSFFFWWGVYDIFTRAFQNNTSLSAPSINFWAGGFSAQVFWLIAYPSDVVKQRIMTDPLGPDRKFFHWTDAAKAVYTERGWRGFWRGFLPCFLRSFPANAAALTAFEFGMRNLP